MDVPEISADTTIPVKQAIAFAMRTDQGKDKHQVSVCVICNRLIGVESIHVLNKKRILENQCRLSVETYEDFYDGNQLHHSLVNQYSVPDLSGFLLSPRSFYSYDNLEGCFSCFSSLKPSKAKKAGKKPPTHAITDGFVIGHNPSELIIDRENEPRKDGLQNKHISDIICASVAC